MSFGIPKSTADLHSKELKDAMTSMRDTEVLRLDSEGEKQAAIVKKTGVDKSTVSRILKNVSNDQVSQMRQDEEVTPIAEPTYESPFSDEECDTTPAVNPALSITEATNRAIAEQEADQKNSVSKIDQETQCNGLWKPAGTRPWRKSAH